MSLFSILSQSGVSLNAQTAASQTAGNNIDNANTPGYARQQAILETVLPADRVAGAYLGMGAQLQTVDQVRDQFLEAQLPAAYSASANSTAQSDALSSVSALDPNGGSGLASALGAFYGSLQAMSQNPSDLGLRQAVVGAAQTLTLAFNNAGNDLSAARSGLDSQISGDVGQVNSLAASIASLNGQIRQAQASGAAPNDLLDARQRAQDQLEQMTGAVPVKDANGDIGMSLPGGVALVSGTASATLSTTPNAANGGHLDVQITRTDGTGPVTLAGSSFGGSFGGMLTARDGALATAESSVDQLAFDFANTVNAVHKAGFGLDGNSGRVMFDVGATAAGAATSIQVDAAISGNPSLIAAASTAAGVPGDATALINLIDTQQTALSTGSNSAGTLSNIIAQFGAAAQTASNASTTDQAAQQQLDTLRQSTSGVSIDQETINLTQSQRSYDAITKVITTTDAMLQTLMSMTSGIA